MAKWSVDRSIEIDAPVSKVFELVSDFRTWTSWSPWLIADPQTKVDISQPADQIGSTYHWSSDIVGEGELEHRVVERNSYLESRLQFIRPMKSTCKTDFRFEPVDQRTRLTWTIQGTLPWYLFWLKPMITSMIGMDYQRGLMMIRELSSRGTLSTRTEVLGVESFASIRIAGFPARVSLQDIGGSISEAIARLQKEYREEGLPLEGALTAVYTRFNMRNSEVDYLIGRAIPETLIMPTHSTLTEIRHPSCRALHIRHTGSYEHLGNAWSVANRIAQHQRLKLDPRARFEIYATMPTETPDHELQTDIYLPLRG